MPPSTTGSKWCVGFVNVPRRAAIGNGFGIGFLFTVEFRINRSEWPTTGQWRVQPQLYVDGGDEVFLGPDIASAGFEINGGNAKVYYGGGINVPVAAAGSLVMQYECKENGFHLRYSEDNGTTFHEVGIGLLAYENDQTFNSSTSVAFYGKVWTLDGGPPLDVGIYDLTITCDGDDLPLCAKYADLPALSTPSLWLAGVLVVSSGLVCLWSFSRRSRNVPRPRTANG